MRERGTARRVDRSIAAAVLAFGIGDVLLHGVPGSETAALALWTAAGIAVVWRRAHPVAFFAFALGVQACSIGFKLSPGSAAVAPLYLPLALFGLGAYVRDARLAVPAALGVVVLMLMRTGLDLLGALPERTPDVVVRELAIFVPAAVGGALLRDRTEALAHARRRARLAAAAADDGGAVELALGAERRRIARELHAVVTGCVRAVLDEVAAVRTMLRRAGGPSGAAGAIGAAWAAGDVWAAWTGGASGAAGAISPEPARVALRRARDASQQAMAEMRRMLMLLRSSEAVARPDASEVPASLRELTDRGAGAIDVRRAHAGAPPQEERLPAVAMRVLVALAELPGCTRVTVERGDGFVRASARIRLGLGRGAVEALAERARLAGGRLRRGPLRRSTLTVVLPTHSEHAARLRAPSAWLRLAPRLSAQLLPLLMLALELTEALLAAGKPAEFYGSASVPVRVVGAVALAAAFLPRRRWPLASVLLVVAVALVRCSVLDDAFGLNAPLYVAAFIAGAYVRLPWAAALGGLACIAGGIATVMFQFGWNLELYPTGVLLFFATMTAAAWATGIGGRRRVAEAQELRALSAAEEQRQARAIERVVEAERLRVARELHDLVGHGLTSITLQCAVADQLLGARSAVAGDAIADPGARPTAGAAHAHAQAAAATAIAAVEEVGEEVLRELDQLLAALDGRREAAAPQLSRLPELARRAEAHGLDVRLKLVGDVAAVPAGHAGAAYRIVQEALTNARKHGGAVAVAVRVAHERERLTIEVRNEIALGRSIPTAPATGAGLGIAGMRERVRLYDGWLVAGPDGADAWAVRAELPLTG
ncbi:sensor histidine kinase [Conexibacter sp. CPCC 206217]|uniref:sensor histidine kinase n=1 Tax=Conexibacter sp. CPCC 206217 TaxID=3064574 RepID=UPI002721985F|nr:histidine kinase [Conexibacter sp. CPCC 206217]MDO8213331.1 histidine kinase [Conexibacter sp. CPCC 206217]